MIKNREIFHNQIRKPYWGVLARDLNLQAVHKPENFMNLLQTQSQKTDVVPVSDRGSAIPVSGKHKSNRLSKNIPL